MTYIVQPNKVAGTSSLVLHLGCLFANRHCLCCTGGNSLHSFGLPGGSRQLCSPDPCDAIHLPAEEQWLAVAACSAVWLNAGQH